MEPSALLCTLCEVKPKLEKPALEAFQLWKFGGDTTAEKRKNEQHRSETQLWYPPATHVSSPHWMTQARNCQRNERPTTCCNKNLEGGTVISIDIFHLGAVAVVLEAAQHGVHHQEARNEEKSIYREPEQSEIRERDTHTARGKERDRERQTARERE